MGLFTKKETEEQVLKRLAGNAGHMIEMFKAHFNTSNGVDIFSALIFTSALAGHACHRAVKAEGGVFSVVSTKTGKNFYFGDDVNKYLLESRLSVVSFCTAVTDVTGDDVLKIAADQAMRIGAESNKICGYDPGPLYEQVSQCWDGIYDNMISKYCNSSAEWPILFGIVLQNILIAAINAGAPKDEAGRIAVECAMAVSKMDSDSF